MNNRRAIRILFIALIVFSVFSINSLLRNRTDRKTYTCIQNLKTIEGVKEQFAIEHAGQAPEGIDILVPQYLAIVPKCPAGGSYAIGDMQILVTCDIEGHQLPP